MALRFILLLVALCIFLLDRITKSWVEHRISNEEVRTVIPGFLNIIHSQNPDMAFSLLSTAPAQLKWLFLVGVSSIAAGLVAWFVWRSENLIQRLALMLILGGTVGNLYDRLIRGSVTDFIDLYWGEYHWFTFNVADSAISVGTLMIIVTLLLHRSTATLQPVD
jgi:signal peptidase II